MPEKKINIITVDPLTTDWWIGLTSTIILIFALLFIAKKLSEPNRRKFEIGMGIFLLLREVVRNWFLIYTNNWEAQTSLPLELCEFFSIASGLLFFKFNKTWYEILLLGGIAGALQSIITPELRLVFYPESIIEAYVSHGGIIFAALYFFFIKKEFVDKKSILRTILWVEGIFFFVMICDFFLDANYMFLKERPLNENPLIIGDWPWYIIGFQIIGIVHIFLLYYLFKYLERKVEPVEEDKITS